ncbi:hypothetical protein FF38_00970 [Lucilia cuprina]|uniref:Uncharacterized protein n=1 Tax=Lucilia cuprina TaxID=7375 RepID=A0A0L0BUF2_LUCCU|nr:hypothetical protein FF38_00970 [Lucilia cuprina]
MSKRHIDSMLNCWDGMHFTGNVSKPVCMNLEEFKILALFSLQVKFKVRCTIAPNKPIFFFGTSEPTCTWFMRLNSQQTEIDRIVVVVVRILHIHTHTHTHTCNTTSFNVQMRFHNTLYKLIPLCNICARCCYCCKTISSIINVIIQIITTTAVAFLHMEHQQPQQ